MSESKLVNYEVQSGLAILTLNNPPANCYSYEMMRELDDAILQARMDDDVHVILLRGQGDKFFCAGADIATLKSVTTRYKYFFCLHANETLNRLEQTPKLTIAALSGHTVGGGLEVAMACDLRYARRDSGKIGLPEVQLGVLPGTGGTQRLTRLLGRSRAMELMISGRVFSFDEAKDIGLVHDVFDSEGYWDQLMEKAKSFTPPNKASQAVGLIKRSVVSGADMSFDSGLSLERELQQRLFEGDDAREGLAAYTEKRPPNFRGC